jgi:hypothetical protein
MPLLIIFAGLLLPRLVIFILNFFSDWFDGVFDSWVILLLGFIFLPYTALWYSAVINWYDGVWGFWQVAIMVLAIIADLSSHMKKKFKHN